MLVFGLTRLRLEPTTYRTRGEHANHYIIDPILKYINGMEYCDMKYRVLHKYSIFLHSRFFSVIVVIYAYNIQNISDMVWFMVLNATFNNISAISWRPVLVGEEAGVPGENHRQGQATGKLDHLRMPVKCTLFCNIQSKCNVSTCNCNKIFVPAWNLFHRNLFHRKFVVRTF